MKIAVIMEYTHNKVGVETMEIAPNQLPLDVAPGMVCDKLEEIPTSAVYLGKSIPHHSPSDVIVVPVSETQAAAINRVYSTPVSDLEPGESLEYYAKYENEIRAEAAINLAKSFM